MVLNFCSVPKRTTNFVTCEELITLVDFLLSYFRGDNLMEEREIFDTVAASGSVRLLLTNLKDDVKNITDIHVLLTRTFEIYSVSQYVFLNADVFFFFMIFYLICIPCCIFYAKAEFQDAFSLKAKSCSAQFQLLMENSSYSVHIFF